MVIYKDLKTNLYHSYYSFKAVELQHYSKSGIVLVLFYIFLVINKKLDQNQQCVSLTILSDCGSPLAPTGDLNLSNLVTNTYLYFQKRSVVSSKSWAP